MRQYETMPRPLSAAQTRAPRVKKTVWVLVTLVPGVPRDVVKDAPNLCQRVRFQIGVITGPRFKQHASGTPLAVQEDRVIH